MLAIMAFKRKFLPYNNTKFPHLHTCRPPIMGGRGEVGSWELGRRWWVDGWVGEWVVGVL
jgi:hypothetical protein